MGLDTSIYNAFAAPYRSARDYENDYADLEDRKQKRAVNALSLQGLQDQANERKRTLMEADTLRNALARLGPDATDEQRIAAAKGTGLAAGYTQADALQKMILERQKTEAQTTEQRANAAKANAEALGKHLGVMKDLAQQVMANPTPQAAMASVEAFERLTGIQNPQDRQILATLQSPDDIRRWAAGHALQAEKLLPQFQFVDNGKLKTPVDMNAITNPGGPKPITMTTTPGEDLTANTSRANNAATVAATIRGQNLTDARSREQLAAGKWQYDADRGGLVNMQTGEFKPATQAGAPIGAKDKPLNDSQAKSYGFGSRMQAADQILAGLAAKGVTRGGNVNAAASSIPLVGGAADTLTNWTQSPEQQQVMQAKRDFMTAALRRESGASIAPSEFETFDKTYFPQVGDDKQTVANKAALRKRAIEGVLVEVPDGKRPKTPASGDGWSIKPKG